MRCQVHSLREQMIGAEVFASDRHDTSNDVVVRVKVAEAGRMRTQDYRESENNRQSRIKLPISSYVLKFQLRCLTSPSKNPAQPFVCVAEVRNRYDRTRPEPPARHHANPTFSGVVISATYVIE